MAHHRAPHTTASRVRSPRASLHEATSRPLSALTSTRRHRYHRRRRRGQLLVECLMAMTLVSVASVMLVSTSVSMATLGDDALQLARAQREQGNAAGRALLAPCDTALASANVVRWPSPRLRLQDALDAGGSLHRSRTEAHWTPSALAIDAARVLRVSSAARCR